MTAKEKPLKLWTLAGYNHLVNNEIEVDEIKVFAKGGIVYETRWFTHERARESGVENVDPDKWISYAGKRMLDLGGYVTKRNPDLYMNTPQYPNTQTE